MQDSNPNSTFKAIATNSIASSLAILPTYYPFVWNGAKQLGRSRPPMNLNNTVIWPLQGSLILGCVIGAQLTLSSIISDYLKKREIHGIAAEYTSTLLVAALTAPGLIVDKGRTFGFSIAESLRRSNLRTFAGLTFRESAFLFSVPLGHRINSHLIVYLGDNTQTQYLSVALGGATGCTLGYAADTILARSLHNMPLSLSPTVLYSGLTPKIIGVSGFYCFHKFFMEKLNPPTNTV